MTTRLTVESSPLNIMLESDFMGARDPVQQQFTIGLNASRLIYAAPQPIRIDLPTRTDLRYTPDDETRTAMNVSVIRPLRVLERGDTYTVTSLLTNASASQLRAAPTTYPEWLSQIYLQVSPSVTNRTAELARVIVNEANATTPYDRAKAIETWLRSNIVYNETIPQPPADQDPVDWLLFDLREGYCNYYASAMIMMLRTLGIPARMAAGFAQGTWDAAQNAYVVQERDAHTWVEVFSPAMAGLSLNRPQHKHRSIGLMIFRLVLCPALLRLHTPTPSATPSPTITPTPDPLTPQPQAGLSQPTVTPTFTPSPTATPVIVPTQPPPLTPQPAGPLSFLLPALGAALVVLLIIGLIAGIGVFTWWWWEWRGMGGLSPVTRAYARLERYLNLIGLKLGTEQTPEERRQRIVRMLPKAEPPVSAITRMYTAERYGRNTQTPHDTELQSEVADEAWADTRTNILQRFLRRFLPWTRR